MIMAIWLSILTLNNMALFDCSGFDCKACKLWPHFIPVVRNALVMCEVILKVLCKYFSVLFHM